MKKSHDLGVRASRNGLGFYVKPALVPQRIGAAQALEAFDRRQSRIYIVPNRVVVYPEDLSQRKGYSYHRDDWWKLIIAKNELSQWEHAGLFAIWDRILSHARRQCFNARERQTRRNVKYLDFYHFVEPEIQRIDATTSGGKKYELRYSPDQDYYFYNFYSGGK